MSEDYNVRASEGRIFPDVRGWYSLAVARPKLEAEIQILFLNGQIRPAMLLWQEPTYEENHKGYHYFDCPYDDGQDWDWNEIAYWREKPDYPLGFKVRED